MMSVFHSLKKRFNSYAVFQMLFSEIKLNPTKHSQGREMDVRKNREREPPWKPYESS